jgi:hypothetical protein
MPIYCALGAIFNLNMVRIIQFQEAMAMATNPPKGDGHRNGAVRGRSQTQTPSGHYVKRNTATGQFMDVKTTDKTPFKGVRKE